MAWVRKTDSGKWAATVYTPAGRITESHKLKSVIEGWADDLETDIRRNEFIDPRRGEITVADWKDKCQGGRHMEKASRARDESHWRCHVKPYWGKRKVSSILKPDITAWVVHMNEKQKLGAATIQGSLGVLRGLLEQAVDARIIRTNPAVKVRTPRRTKHVDRVLHHDEEIRLLDRLTELFGERPDGRLFVEMLLGTGLRWEELAALPRELVDLRRGLVTVGPVMERDGTIRDYPKADASARTVPVDEHVWPRFREHVLTVPPGRTVFVSETGKNMHYANWLRRVWGRALTLEVPDEERRAAWQAAKDAQPVGEKRTGPMPKFVRRVTYLGDPQPTPHDCRHTFATRLGDEGVPSHELAAILGHASIVTVQRYLHAGDDRFDRARKALRRARA